MTRVRRLVLQGEALRVRESEPADPAAEPVYVLVHGIGMSHRYLRPLHRELEASGRVVSVDLPGFGGLPRPSTRITVPRMGHLLAEMLSTLGTDRVILIGHSMGAQWVLEAARVAPELVAGVVLIGPVTDAGHRTLGAQAAALAIDTLRERPAVNALVFTDYLRCGPRWYLAQAAEMVSFRAEDSLAASGPPALIIRGERDAVAGGEWCRLLRDVRTDVELVEIADQPHNVHHSAAARVADAVVDRFGARAAPARADAVGHGSTPSRS